MSNPNPETKQLGRGKRFDDLTPEEMKEYIAKAVAARKENAIKRKTSRELAQKWLRHKAPKELVDKMISAGFAIEDFESMEDIIMAGHTLKASTGNDRAYRLLLEVSGVLLTQGTSAGITPEKMALVQQTLESIKNKENGTGTTDNSGQGGTAERPISESV